MIFDSLKTGIIVGILAFCALVPSCITYNYMDNKVEKVTKDCINEKDAMIVSYKEKLLNAQIDSLEQHNKLLEDQRKITDAKNAEIKRVSANLSTALNSLRDRPSRPDPSASSPDVQSPGHCEAGTGSGLSREDAEFLTREAARANEIRATAKEAYEQYDSLKDKINTLFDSQAPPAKAP